MKASKLREMTIEELERKLQELREEHFKLRFQASTSEIEKPHLIGEVRRDIARVLTIIKEQRAIPSPENVTQ